MVCVTKNGAPFSINTEEEHQVKTAPGNEFSESDRAEEEHGSAGGALGVTEEDALTYEVPWRRRHGKPLRAQKEWYSKTEAARYLGVAEITITRYLDRGLLQAHRLP